MKTIITAFALLLTGCAASPDQTLQMIDNVITYINNARP